MTEGEHTIIVMVDLTSNPGGVKVDVGNLSPAVAALCLQRAVDALEIQPEPIVTIVHDNEEIAVTADVNVWSYDGEDDDDE